MRSQELFQSFGTDVTLTDILKNRVNDECLAVFSTNGTMVKIQKSKLLQSFLFAPLDFTDLQNYTAVVDMGFFWKGKGTKRSRHGQIMLITYFLRL